MLLKFLFALQKYENKVKRPISSSFFCVKMMFQWHTVPILWPSERKSSMATQFKEEIIPTSILPLY